MLPLIGVTMGDPAGIGPEVVLKAALAAPRTCRLVVLGDLATLTETAVRLGAPLTLVSWQPGDPYPAESNVLPVLVLSQLAADERQPGRPTPAGGEASYGYVETGTRLALDNTLLGLVTAPISKAMWHAAGHTYPGHTELLAALTGTAEVRMMLVGSRLRVILTLKTSRHGHRPTVICTSLVTRTGGAPGGCAARAPLFAAGPLASGQAAIGSGSDEFITISGLASDDVARIVAFLADGETMPVRLVDNVYVVDIARSRLPARLVAYDVEKRVIGFFTQTRGPGAPSGPSPGRARLVLHGVSSTGSTAELFVGKSTNGGRCVYCARI